MNKVLLWHFDNPNLYDFRFVIPGSDEVKDRFGFRVFKKEEKRFVLNGEPMRFPGIEPTQFNFLARRAKIMVILPKY